MFLLVLSDVNITFISFDAAALLLSSSPILAKYKVVFGALNIFSVSVSYSFAILCSSQR